MKNILLVLNFILLYVLITFLDKTYITTESKIFDFLAKNYPSSVVQNYMESKLKDFI